MDIIYTLRAFTGYVTLVGYKITQIKKLSLYKNVGEIAYHIESIDKFPILKFQIYDISYGFYTRDNKLYLYGVF